MVGGFVSEVGRILCESAIFGLGACGGSGLDKYDHFRGFVSVYSGRFKCETRKRKTGVVAVGVLCAGGGGNGVLFLDREIGLAAAQFRQCIVARVCVVRLEHAGDVSASEGMDVDGEMYLRGGDVFVGDDYARIVFEHTFVVSDGGDVAFDVAEVARARGDSGLVADDCDGRFDEAFADVFAVA